VTKRWKPGLPLGDRGRTAELARCRNVWRKRPPAETARNSPLLEMVENWRRNLLELNDLIGADKREHCGTADAL
jgi:hypothetical protein